MQDGGLRMVFGRALLVEIPRRFGAISSVLWHAPLIVTKIGRAFWAGTRVRRPAFGSAPSAIPWIKGHKPSSIVIVPIPFVATGIGLEGNTARLESSTRSGRRTTTI